jgi:hypothetical protein
VEKAIYKRANEKEKSYLTEKLSKNIMDLHLVLINLYMDRYLTILPKLNRKQVQEIAH